MLFAAKSYTNRAATTQEFLADFNKIDNICKNVSKQRNGININIRLLLNQIVTTANLFGVESLVDILICKIETEYHGVLYPLLIYLGYMTDEQLTDHTVEFDATVVEKLRSMD